MDTHAKIASSIIKAQEAIVGPVALEQAKKVSGLKIGSSDADIKIEGDKKAVLDQLIKQYESLFGRASVEVCKNAVRSLTGSLPKDQLPQLLTS